MKAFLRKILPWGMMLLGAMRLLWERFPNRLPFLSVLGGDYHGWIFWLIGISGGVWLLLRALPHGSISVEKGENSGTGLSRFFHRYGIELLILLLTAASLSMLIRSGYFWDDAVNSTAYLAQKKDAVPTFRHVLEFMGDYLRLGRINVLSVYYYFFFYIENVSVYKALIILSILINQLIFRKVLLEFGVPLSGARLGMLLIPMLLQTRIYQDPVSGFYSLMQVLTAEMLLCALFLMRWLNGGKGRHLALSLVLFAAGLLTYEVCFPFLAMICVLIWVNRGSFKQAVRESLPFVGVTLLMVIAVIVVRSRFLERTYAGVAFSLDPARIVQAAWRQFIAGLPLSYYSAGYQAAVMDHVYPAAEFMNYDFGSFLRSVQLSDVLIVLIALAVMNRIRAVDWGVWKDKRHELLVLGVSFAVLPIITIAVSERYQGQLMPGLGYLPVYMQYYGVAMLLLWVLPRFRDSECARAFCMSAFSLILLLNLQNNRAVTDLMNRHFYDPRNAGEAALRGGLLDFLPEDAVLVSLNDRRYLWEADWNNAGLYQEFYGNHSRRIPASVGDTRLLKPMIAEDSGSSVVLEPENVWVVEYHGNPGDGFARLGRLRQASVDAETLELEDVVTDQVLYFFSGVYPEQKSVQYTKSDGKFIQIERLDQFRVRAAQSGLLYQLPKEEEIYFFSLTEF